MMIEKIGLKDDKNKLRMDLVLPEAIEEMAKVLTNGAEKYKPNSWQNVVDGKDKHYASLMRHLMRWRAGSKGDKESGLSHISHILTNAMFLLYHERRENDTDKRK